MTRAHISDSVDTDTDRRRYYRIQDQVCVRYEIITECGDELPSKFQIISELSRHAESLGLIPEDVCQRTPELGRYLRSVERCLGDITRFMVVREMEGSEARVHEVSMSGGGLAFYARDRLSVGARVRLELFMVSTCTALVVTASVVRCELRPGRNTHPHWIAVKFEPLHDRDRDRLIKHILTRQAHDLRRTRSVHDPSGLTERDV